MKLNMFRFENPGFGGNAISRFFSKKLR